MNKLIIAAARDFDIDIEKVEKIYNSDPAFFYENLELELLRRERSGRK